MFKNNHYNVLKRFTITDTYPKGQCVTTMFLSLMLDESRALMKFGVTKMCCYQVYLIILILIYNGICLLLAHSEKACYLTWFLCSFITHPFILLLWMFWIVNRFTFGLISWFLVGVGFYYLYTWLTYSNQSVQWPDFSCHSIWQQEPTDIIDYPWGPP